VSNNRSRYLPEPLLLVVAALALLILLEYTLFGVLAPLERYIGDRLLRVHAGQQQPDPEIVIVDIDEHSLEQMSAEVGRFPWPRSVHAELVEGIARQQPHAIVFDILFSDPDLMRPEGDAYFAEVAAVQSNLFLPMLRLEGGNDAEGVELGRYGAALGIEPGVEAESEARVAIVLPLPELMTAGRLGSINFNEDSDGVGRHYRLYLDAYGWKIPSLPTTLLRALDYPLPPLSEIQLSWRGPPLSYQRIPYADLYRDLQRRQPQRNPRELHDKIVIIGSTATGLVDLRVTPIDSIFPAVEILATAIDNLKRGDYLRSVPLWVSPLLALLMVLLIYSGFRRLGSPLQMGIRLLLFSPLMVVAAYVALTTYRLQLPLFVPLAFAWIYYVAASLHSYLRELKAREQSVAIFSRFLDPRVVGTLVAQGESVVDMRGESRKITVLFSDIRGFTTLSEQSSAEQIVALLNDYFSRQVKVVFRHGGTVDKFIGDAIMAFWGAPVDDAEQAQHAVAAALDMADALFEFKRSLGAAGESFDVGIGIHTGEAVVGFIGSENRLDYTAIGDTVNLASRIEGQTKGRARILVSEATMLECGDLFDFHDHGSYKVKGRAQEVRLFEPLRRLT